MENISQVDQAGVKTWRAWRWECVCDSVEGMQESVLNRHLSVEQMRIERQVRQTDVVWD